LARLDQILAAVAELRDEVAASSSPAANGAGEGDDFADGSLLDTNSASIRFNFPRDTIALWCRQGDGKKVGGRWMVSIPRLQKRVNGG
jgi:hypothetical protein